MGEFDMGTGGVKRGTELPSSSQDTHIVTTINLEMVVTNEAAKKIEMLTANSASGAWIGVSLYENGMF